MREGTAERVRLRRKLRPEALTEGLRHGARRLIRAPTFAVVTVLSVGFGAGAFAAILSVVNGALLESPPYRDVDRLVWVWRNYTWFQFDRGWLGGPDIAYLRERTEAFDAVVAFDGNEANLTDPDGGAPEEVRVIAASDEFFEVLGVSPRLGRGFAAGDSDPAAAPVVVLDYDFWQRRYGGDPAIVGRDIRLQGDLQRVIGVMPRGFRFVMHSSLGDPVPADLYANLQLDLAGLNAGSGNFAALARIREGAGERVQPALDAVAAQLDAEAFGERGLELWSVGLEEDLVAKVRPALLALLGAGTFLLLALAANLAALLVTRAADRSREVAVRSALGATRLGSVLDLVGESLLVCVAGCALGLAVAPFAVRALLGLAPASLPRIEAIGVDGTVIAVTFGACLLLGIAAALGPALAVASRPVWAGLRSAGPRAGGSIHAGRSRAVLVATQVALSVVLLVGAGLLARSVAALLRVDPGFEPAGVLTFRAPLDGSAYDGTGPVAQFHRTLRERLAALPGVTYAGAVNAIPLGSSTNQTAVAFPGAPGNTGDRSVDLPLIDWFAATPGYFDAMGIAVLEGRGIEERDVADAAPVAVIDETLARQFYPGASVVGRTMAFGADTLRVVGVVRHARFYNVFADDRGEVYVPHAQASMAGMYYALRTEREPTTLSEPVRRELRALDASVPLTEVRTLETVVRDSLGQHRLSLVLLGAFAFGALVLATMGIYGVVATSVARRTHEFGVRLALGAGPRNIVRLVLRDGVLVIGTGVVLGAGGAIFATRVLRTLLFGLRPADPATFAAVAALVGIVGVMACAIPGWRATRIPPTDALRTD